MESCPIKLDKREAQTRTKKMSRTLDFWKKKPRKPMPIGPWILKKDAYST